MPDPKTPETLDNLDLPELETDDLFEEGGEEQGAGENPSGTTESEAGDNDEGEGDPPDNPEGDAGHGEEPGSEDDSGDGEDGSEGDGEEPNGEADSGDGEDGDGQYITVGDERYTEDELADALKDSRNKREWSRSNTQKAQELAEKSKAVDPLVKFIQKFAKNEEFVKDVRETFVDEYGEEAGELFDNAVKFDLENVQTEYGTRLDEAKSEIESLKGQILVRENLDKTAEKFKLDKKQTQGLHDFWVDKFHETGEIMSFEDAYKLMDYENKEREARKARRNPPKPPPNTGNNKRGARKFAKSPAKSIDEIDISDADLFEE